MTRPLRKRLQRAHRQIEAFTEVQVVNFSVDIEVVGPRREVQHRRRLGGLYDVGILEWIDDAPEAAVTWTLSRDQYEALEALERIILQGGPTRYVFVGGMGSGKTVGQSHCAALFAFYRKNGNVGMVAPVRPRLGILRDKFCAALHPSWIVERRDYTVDEPPFVTLLPALRYQFVATKSGGSVQGNPVQGYDWQGCFPDEEQDSSTEAMAHVALRGRAAVDGRYPVVSTCTIKDTPEFRDRLAKYEADPGVVVKNMSLLDNPFVDEQYKQDLKSQLTPRQWDQLVLGRPQPPERQTYQFQRSTHVIPRPSVGARDITKRVTNGAEILIGHDPGELCDVSILLKCYEVGGKRLWWVIDELTTDRTTSEQHAVALRKLLNTKWDAQWVRANRDGTTFLDETEAQVLIRADPHGSTDGKPDIAVYRHFQIQHFAIRPAAYRLSRDPVQASKPGVVKREARIEVVNTLLRNAAGESRLFIDCNERGYPAAPKLATALEMSQRDEFGRAEMQRKGEHDLSHWPSALGFALYSYERARVGMQQN